MISWLPCCESWVLVPPLPDFLSLLQYDVRPVFVSVSTLFEWRQWFLTFCRPGGLKVKTSDSPMEHAKPHGPQNSSVFSLAMYH